jgi:hypothetical protein
VIVQDRAEELRAHPAAAVLLVFHDQEPVVRLCIEATVTDEVKDVVLVLSQATLQLREGGILLPLHGHEPVLLQLAERFGDLRALAFDVQLRVVAGARDHHEHPQWRLDDERPDPFGKLQVTHERCFHRQAEEAVHAGVVEELPGQIGKRRDFGQVKTDPQTGPLPAGLVQAASQAPADLARKDLIEQPAAKLLRRHHLRRLDTADRMPAAADAKQEVLDLEIGERRAESAGGLPDRRVEDSRGETMAGRFDGDVEIDVLQVAHEWCSAALKWPPGLFVFQTC